MQHYNKIFDLNVNNDMKIQNEKFGVVNQLKIETLSIKTVNPN